MIMLHINSVYCVPNIIKIGQHLQKLQSSEKGEHFLRHSVYTNFLSQAYLFCMFLLGLYLDAILQ